MARVENLWPVNPLPSHLDEQGNSAGTVWRGSTLTGTVMIPTLYCHCLEGRNSEFSFFGFQALAGWVPGNVSELTGRGQSKQVGVEGGSPSSRQVLLLPSTHKGMEGVVTQFSRVTQPNMPGIF